MISLSLLSASSIYYEYVIIYKKNCLLTTVLSIVRSSNILKFSFSKTVVVLSTNSGCGTSLHFVCIETHKESSL